MREAEDIETAVTGIVADREHGARWLARACAETMALACESPASKDTIGVIHALARRLASARPSMAAVANTVARIWSAGLAASSTDNVDARLERMDNEARRLRRYWDAVDEGVLRHAAPARHGAVYTHSRSGTVEAVLKAITPSHGETRRVVVAESRPGGEGVGLAEALFSAGWEVTLIADAASGLFVPNVDAVLVGADSIRPDGSVVNKVGTYPLALVAHTHGKPLYVLCESLKVAPAALPLTLERLPSMPLTAPTAGAVQLDTIAFDCTPAHLVTRIITERGPLSLQEIAQTSDEASVAYDALLADDATAAEEG